MRRQPQLNIRVETKQTWILADRQTGNDVGGVTYRHDPHGNHYQPWLMIDGQRQDIGPPLPQLGQAAREIEGAALDRREPQGT